MKEKLSPDEVQLLKLLSDGKKKTTSAISKQLKWKKDKVQRIRRSLEQKGLVKKTRYGNVFFYSIIFASASTFLLAYGIMKSGDRKLKSLILQEQQQRMSADRYLDERLTTQEQSFVSMISDMQKQEQMNNIETMNLIYALQNEDSYIKQDILNRYNLTQSDINRLRQTVDLNDLYYNTQFGRAGVERAGILAGLTQEQQARLYGEQLTGERITSAERRLGYTESDISGLRGNISDIYGYLDEDDEETDKKDDSGDDSTPSRTEQDYFESRDIPEPGEVYTAPTDPKKVTYVRTIR